MVSSDHNKKSKQSSHTLQKLVKKLQSDDFNTREDAIHSIAEIPTDEAFSALVDALSSNYTNVRVNAARILGNVLDPRPIESLVKLLNDLEWQVRITAAWALGEIAGKGNEIDLRKIQEVLGKLEDKKEAINSWAKITNGIRKGKQKINKGKLSEGLPKPPKGRGNLVRMGRVHAR